MKLKKTPPFHCLPKSLELTISHFAIASQYSGVKYGSFSPLRRRFL
jgi:hypothetical protein